MQFTEKYIQALKAKPDRYDVRENSGKGFGIRVSSAGEKSWIFFYMFGGRKRRMTLGSYPELSLAEARKMHRDALKILEHNNDPSLEKQKQQFEARTSSTVKDLIEEYLEKWAKPRKRSWREDQRILYKDVLPIWGKRKAKDITKREIILLLDEIKERGAPIIANRTLAVIRRMFNFAVERDIVCISPCLSVKAPAKENRRERLLTEDEVKSFWVGLDVAPISELIKLALKFQLVTGQRKGEVVSAEWLEIDLKTRWWTIPAAKAKNGNPHRVALSGLALEILSEIKKLSGDSRWLFPSSKNDTHLTPTSIDHSVRRCMNLFHGVHQFTPHDLRRTAASHMTSAGISRLVVSKILNHVESGVTAIYDRHSYDAEKRRALEAWGERLGFIVFEKELNTKVVNLR